MENITNTNFNSHAHVERDLLLMVYVRYILYFNSHAHVERDLAENICQLFHVVISTHTLTWSVTKGFRNAAEQICISTHTLTWSVTRLKNSLIPWKSNFNSHAHVERDRGKGIAWHWLAISTHTLTWSVTEKLLKCRGKQVISTHTLTWSVTRWNKCQTCVGHFNSHAHVERDGSKWFKPKQGQVSTHTLTWSVTIAAPTSSKISRFQLTRSRGAWQRQRHSMALISNFNSHAHVERDGAHRRRQVDHGYFNSHAHVERDVLNLGLTNAQNISTHTLTWSVTNNFQ